MMKEKDNKEKSGTPFFTYLRRDVLHIRPRIFILNILHYFAMNCPIHRIRLTLYRLRGTIIGKNVFLAPFVFLEEAYPELITIEENTDLGPRVMIITHDTVLRHLKPGSPALTFAVFIGKNCYLGAGAIILPGVTIGDDSIIGAGAVVTKSIPPGSVAMGVPASVVSTREEWCRKHLVYA